MRLRGAVLLLTIGGAGFFPAAAAADRVILQNGSVFEGEVTATETHVIIRIATGSVTLSRGQVAAIEAKESPLQGYERQRVALGDADLDGRVALALEAEGAGMHTLARAEFRAVLARDPEHAGAHAALGEVKQGDTWLTRDEQKRLLGLMRDAKGRWISIEEARLRLDERNAEAERERTVADAHRLEAEAEKLRAEAAAIEADTARGASARVDAVLLHPGRGWRAVGGYVVGAECAGPATRGAGRGFGSGCGPGSGADTCASTGVAIRVPVGPALAHGHAIAHALLDEAHRRLAAGLRR